MAEQKKFSLTARIAIAMFAGLLTGLLLQFIIGKNDEYFLNLGVYQLPLKAFFADGVFYVIGQIFVASLKMLVVPLVFVSLVVGTCSLGDTAKLGRLGGKSISLYLVTTAVAITIAISLALIFEPGVGVNMASDAAFQGKESPGLAKVLIDMFPSNPINAMAEGNMLQVIVFSLLFGIAMALSGKPGERLLDIFKDLNEVILKLVVLLMNLAPYGVFALMARTFTTLKADAILNLGVYFMVVLLALFTHALVTFPVLMKTLAGLNPLKFLAKMKDAALFAFSTASSSATMPITMETATKKLGVNNSIASFTVPLGATINMDGTAIMQGVATVFIAQAFNVDLSIADYLTVILTATLASVGTAGVPGVGLVMLAMVLDQVGLPLEGIAIIMGVDRLLDMTRTAVNVTGDCMVSCVIAKSENEFNEATFNNARAGEDIENIDDAAFIHPKK